MKKNIYLLLAQLYNDTIVEKLSNNCLLVKVGETSLKLKFDIKKYLKSYATSSTAVNSKKTASITKKLNKCEKCLKTYLFYTIEECFNHKDWFFLLAEKFKDCSSTKKIEQDYVKVVESIVKTSIENLIQNTWNDLF